MHHRVRAATMPDETRSAGGSNLNAATIRHLAYSVDHRDRTRDIPSQSEADSELDESEAPDSDSEAAVQACWCVALCASY